MNLLIIEDDRDILDFLKHSLKEEGFVVDTAEDGKTGMRKLRINDYDLLILDLGLPHMSGREICAEARALGKAMPILVLSAEGELARKVDLLLIGADDYLVKPFSFAELSARIKALMRRPREIESDTVQIGDLVLDTGRRVVHRAGEEIRLTPKEFFLLEYLMRNRGRALSRMELLEHVWDVNADPFTNTVETHVSNLRRKLKSKTSPSGSEKQEKELIHSISGMGYKMD